MIAYLDSNGTYASITYYVNARPPALTIIAAQRSIYLLGAEIEPARSIAEGEHLIAEPLGSHGAGCLGPGGHMHVSLLRFQTLALFVD